MTLETPVRPQLEIPTNIFFFNPDYKGYFTGKPITFEVATFGTVFWRVTYYGMFVVLIFAILTAITSWEAAPIWIMLAILVLGIQRGYLTAVADGRINDSVQAGKAHFIVGKILSCEGWYGWTNYSDRPRPYYATIHYTFRNPDGKMMTRTITQRYHHLDIAPLPNADTPVMLLYLSDVEHYLL